MKNSVMIFLVSLSAFTCFAVNAQNPLDTVKSNIDAKSELSPQLKSFLKTQLVAHSTNPVFVKDIQDQNAKKVSIDAIKKADQEWIEAEEEIPLQKEKLNSASAIELKKIVKDNPAILESFVMDNQGAVVGESSLTSDYWQGDEEKWTNSYKDGKGGIDVGKLKFDKSSNAEVQQVSLPVYDKDGQVIGAVTWGIAVSKLP